MSALSFFRKSKRSSNKFLVLELNSEYVKCLAFYHEGPTCKIIGKGKERLETGAVRGGAIIDMSDVEEALNIAIAQATKDLEENVDQIIVGVANESCMGLSTTVKLNKGQKSRVEKRDMDRLYAQTLEAAYMTVQNEYLNKTGNPDVDLEVITTSDVYTRLDGVETEEVLGKEGKVIEAAIFNAFCPTYHLSSLAHLADNKGLDVVAAGSGMYALAQQLAKTPLENTDYVIVDIANDATNVAVIFGKGIVATQSLNIGYRHFVEGISEKMGLTLIEAEKVLKAHNEEKLTPGESAIVHTCLLEIIDIWLRGLELLFAEFTGVKTFAPMIYMTGVGTQITTLVETVESEPWMKSIPFKAPPEFRMLDMSDFDSIVDSTGHASTAEWIIPASLSVVFMEVKGINGND
jgi:cell division ATPase FtsA